MTVTELYTVQIISYVGETLAPSPLLDAIMAEAEENITDLLPFGYKAKVRRWDNPDPDEGNDDE